ncbi:hypothetical protein LSH36_1g24001 [Paralvinella palmiformis]|uniref:Phosphofurin acidic cluster sorting protein 1/2 C-terminal domain-containing protein n=1 Tax=Paralvinella palmiformis TaxID=53620 RepID=A0AAD9KH74_9ANNE|nr:hypothetical protein LSH36_1g24001 [Paralvinella palmiformis]
MIDMRKLRCKRDGATVELVGYRKMQNRSPDGELSDDDEVVEEQDFSSNEDMSDIEQIPGDDDRQARLHKFVRGPMRPSFSGRQRNIKQKFIALLKRFKVSEDVEEVLDSEQDQELVDPETNPQDIEDLFDELENLSESDPDIDTISVLSTPKPKLRPFFKGKGSSELLDLPKDSGRLSDDSSKKYDSDSHLETDPEYSDSQCGLGASSGREDGIWMQTSPAAPNKPQNKQVLREKGQPTSRKDSVGSSICSNSGRFERLLDRQDSIPGSDVIPLSEPRKVLLDQLGSILSSDDDLPDSLLLINTNEWQGQLLSQLLQDPNNRIISTCSPADVKATLSFLVNKIQKFCNTNSRAPAPIKVAIAGSDHYVNSVLRPFVDQFSAKSPEWQNYIRFLIIPLGGSVIGKYLAFLDGKYSSFFNDTVWREAFEKSDNSSRPADMGEVVKRIHHYMSTAGSVVQLPIAEAMLTFKEKRIVFTLMDVRIGPIDVFAGITSSVDLDDAPLLGNTLSSSPPQNAGLERTRDNHTPPNSPNIAAATISTPSSSTVTSPAGSSPPEMVDLQLDYWTIPTKLESVDKSERLIKKDSKTSLKTTFRSVQVYRLPPVMRIGKKAKDQEPKSQAMEGINRLICTSKTQTHPLTVSIDTVDWFGVKFFQLSAQWQTHVKYFPVLIFGHSDVSAS